MVSEIQGRGLVGPGADITHGDEGLAATANDDVCAGDGGSDDVEAGSQVDDGWDSAGLKRRAGLERPSSGAE